MRKLLAAAMLLVSTQAFALTTQSVFIYGSTMEEVQEKVETFLARVKSQAYMTELHADECNLSNSERENNKRLFRKAYAISFRTGEGNYVVDRNGNFRPVSPSAIVKVSCGR